MNPEKHAKIIIYTFKSYIMYPGNQAKVKERKAPRVKL